MVKQSTTGLVSITVLSALMLVLSFVFNEYNEPNVSLILLFAGLLLAAILVLIVLLPKNSENNLK
jgi:hypothetical protein